MKAIRFLSMLILTSICFSTQVMAEEDQEKMCMEVYVLCLDQFDVPRDVTRQECETTCRNLAEHQKAVCCETFDYNSCVESCIAEHEDYYRRGREGCLVLYQMCMGEFFKLPWQN